MTFKFARLFCQGSSISSDLTGKRTVRIYLHRANFLLGFCQSKNAFAQHFGCPKSCKLDPQHRYPLGLAANKCLPALGSSRRTLCLGTLFIGITQAFDDILQSGLFGTFSHGGRSDEWPKSQLFFQQPIDLARGNNPSGDLKGEPLTRLHFGGHALCLRCCTGDGLIDDPLPGTSR